MSKALIIKGADFSNSALRQIELSSSDDDGGDSTVDTILTPYKEVSQMYTNNSNGVVTYHHAQGGYLFLVSAGDKITIDLKNSGTEVMFRYGVFTNEPSTGSTALQYGTNRNSDSDTTFIEDYPITISESGYLMITWTKVDIPSAVLTVVKKAS